MHRYLHTPINNFVYFIQATRGCSSNCSFCSVTPTFGQPIRYRSVGNVIKEIKTRRKQTQKLLFFYDDNLVGHKKYIKELLAAMIENNCVPFGWHSQMRADVAEDDELVELMGKTKCRLATFGFESINPETLKYIRKGQSVDLIESCVEKMHEQKILINGFFVLGSDKDKIQTIRNTARFAIDKRIDFAAFMPLTPYPGTPFFEDIKDRIFTKNWALYDVQHAVFYPEQMTPLELYSECLKAYQYFYHPITWTKKKFQFYIFTFFGWAIRSQMLYQKELIVNKEYIKFLKSLPPYNPSGKTKIPDFQFKDERYNLHFLASNWYFKKFWRKIIGGKQQKEAYPVVK
jgi:radical SAM superfamily enzyme YgiQ (UPF0313 family)